MTMTQAEKWKKDFDHVFTNVLELSQDDKLVECLHQQGCASLEDVLSLKENQVMNLEYTDSKTGKITPVLLF